MKKISPHTENSLAFHKKVMDSKKSKDVLNAEKNNHANIEKAFIDYDVKFASDSLETLRPITLNGTAQQQNKDKEQLRKIYHYNYKPFQDLLHDITTDRTGRKILNHCPLCTLDIIGSFDHIVPKTEFVEFIDHPKNLIPCCTKCNSTKNKMWRNAGKRLYLNHYIDEPEHHNYLSCHVVWNLFNVPSVVFSLIKPAGINPALYERIEKHYADLDLFTRYKEEFACVIDEICRIFKSLPVQLNDCEKKFLLKKQADELHNTEGKSYWKGHIYDLCATDPKLFAYTIKQSLR